VTWFRKKPDEADAGADSFMTALLKFNIVLVEIRDQLIAIRVAVEKQKSG
jgi:hypothetical protein